MSKGLLLVVSSPSGGGKGTIISKIRENREIAFSVSATTRKPREGEMDAVHYHFLSKEEFEKKISENKMLEYASFCDNFYGTPKEPVEKILNEGKDIILEIEVQGAKNVKKAMPECVSIFIAPPSIKVLEERLRGRGTEDEETIKKRIDRAKIELEMVSDYDYLVINNTVEKATEEVTAIITAEKLKTNRI